MENMENSGWQRIRKSPIFQQNVYVDSHEARGQFSSIEPELCVSLLRVPSLKNFSALHPKLSKCSMQWMTKFLDHGGLDVLMNALEILSLRLSAQNNHIAFMDAFVALECVQCIKAVLNSQAGVFYFLSSPDLVCQLVYGKDFFSIRLFVFAGLNSLARSASYKPEMFACLVVSQFNFSHVFNYYFHVHEKIRCEVRKIEFESVSRCAFYSAVL